MKAVGAFSVTAALFVLVSAWGMPTRSLTWQQVPLLTAQETARQTKKPLLVDFTATWCGACKDLEAHTFSDKAVSKEAGRFVAVRFDATNDEDENVQRTLERLKVRGLPTVLVFDSSGTEVRRFTSFVSPTEFLAALRPVR